MIDWNDNKKRKPFRQALEAAYPRFSDLKQFVDEELGENIEVVASGDNLSNQIFNLINWAKSQGRADELYCAFKQENPLNPWIMEMECGTDQNRSIGEASSDRLAVRVTPDEPLVEDRNSTHLVIAVFWRERNEKLLRIVPKLCYRDPGSNDILQKPFSIQEDYAISLKKFPEFLETLIDLTNQELARLFRDAIEPWTLTVELFVPVDLLSQPLSTWCGPDRELVCDRSIVVGCSDRFDRDRLGDAANLHNQLKQGWQRFKKDVPDTAASSLKGLSWLNSDVAHQKALMSYSGFRCYGHWLKSDETLLPNWLKLVKSGIPLALWMCEGALQQHEIVGIFDNLVSCTRFEFLERIRITRDELQKTCDHDIGIFYEDPTYAPDVPLPSDVQFFGFPSV